ncbi:MAG: hypothetical protein H7A21_12505 [Spirochaetales bacterium]|nr:hypothetical protein [Leptospiraceae bacterium]MCP5482250.1 hypothetical protein [Spirochaetales bacterium]MCP5484638.1 hypothetical protein [Spirochaetales bacterium]
MRRNPFTEADRDQIRAAVQQAEGQTSGEIVPYFVDRSDDYDEGMWRAGLLGMGLATLALLALREYFAIHQEWLPFGLSVSLLIVLSSGVTGILLAFAFPRVRTTLAGAALIERRVAARALQAFVAEEVFSTRDRTGILIFLSLDERRVQVIGDSGINAKVRPEDWEGIVGTIVSHMKLGRAAEGLVLAIKECGQLLGRKAVTIKPDDQNELSDELRGG